LETALAEGDLPKGQTFRVRRMSYQNNRILGYGEFKMFYDTNSKFFGVDNIEWGEFNRLSSPTATTSLQSTEPAETFSLNNILKE